MDKCNLLGYLGECYVILELAKRKIISQKLYDEFDCDLILDNGLNIEVKSSNIIRHQDKRRKTIRKLWMFNNYGRGKLLKNSKWGRNRWCDFYVLVCCDDFKPLKYFIIPNEIITNKKMITIPYKFKRNVKGSFKDYENKWNQLTKNRFLT